MSVRRLAAANPRLVAQLGWLFEAEANALRRDGDSIGAKLLVEALGVPVGWGEPLFDKLDADGDGKLTKEEFEKAEFDPAKLKELLGKLKDKAK
jgi:hypothetical protein